MVGNGTSDAGSGGTLLTTVEQIDPLYVNFTISAADLIDAAQGAANRKGRARAARQDHGPGPAAQWPPYDQPGTLDFSDVAVNADHRCGQSARARAEPAASSCCRACMCRSTSISVSSNGVFLIPQQAIARDTAGAYAMVVGQDGKVIRKDVDANDSYGKTGSSQRDCRRRPGHRVGHAGGS